MSNPWYVIVEGLHLEDVVVGPYPTEEEAEEAMCNSDVVDELCNEDAQDCYTVQYVSGKPPEGVMTLTDEAGYVWKRDSVSTEEVFVPPTV